MLKKVRLPTHQPDGVDDDRGVSLSAERLTLVHRYMLDAEEGRALELRAAEEHARREAEEQFAREVERERIVTAANERRARGFRDELEPRRRARKAAEERDTPPPPAVSQPPRTEPSDKHEARALKVLEKAERRAAKEAARRSATADKREARERKALAKAAARRRAREEKELAKATLGRST